MIVELQIYISINEVLYEHTYHSEVFKQLQNNEPQNRIMLRSHSKFYAGEDIHSTKEIPVNADSLLDKSLHCLQNPSISPRVH